MLQCYSPWCVDGAHLLLGSSVEGHIILFLVCVGVKMNFVVGDIRKNQSLIRKEDFNLYFRFDNFSFLRISNSHSWFFREVTWLSIKSFVSWSPLLVEHWLVSDTRPMFVSFWQLLFSPRLLFITMSLGPSLKDWHRRVTPLISTAPEQYNMYIYFSSYYYCWNEMIIIKSTDLDKCQHWMSYNCGASHFVLCWIDDQIVESDWGPQKHHPHPCLHPAHGTSPSQQSPAPLQLHF